MASATAIAHKRLGEFLKEQQEPFILEDYLLERGCFKRWSTHGSASSCLTQSVLPFSKVLTSLYNKFALHNEGSSKTKQPEIKNDEGLAVPETATIDEADRFSSASSSTLFNSCSDIDEQQASFSSDTCQASSNVCHIGVQSQQAINNGKHPWKCIGPVSLRKILSRRTPVTQNVCLEAVAVNEDARRMEKKMHSCRVLPKKIREDSLLSAAIWGLLIQSVKKESDKSRLREHPGPNVSQILKSKRMLKKTKQLLFDRVKNLPRKHNREQGYRQFLGPQVLRKLIFKTTKQWGQLATCGRNLTFSFTVDDLNSIYRWSDFELHVREISVEFADAILEYIINEIVSENIESLPVI